MTHPVERRFRTAQLHISKRRLPGPFFLDTIFFTTKGICGDKCAQVTTDGKGFGWFWPMGSKRDAHNRLNDFVLTDGIPETIVTDGAGEQGGGVFTRNSRWQEIKCTYNIRHTFTEPHSWWQNQAEHEVKDLRRMMKRLSNRKRSLKWLWCFLGEYVTGLCHVTASTIPSLRGRTPHERQLGYTPNITPWI